MLRKEPYGCARCDSGQLRKQCSEHFEDCPFLKAQEALKGIDSLASALGKQAGEAAAEMTARRSSGATSPE